MGSEPVGGTNMGVWYKGCASASKPDEESSNLSAPANTSEPQILRYHWFDSNRGLAS